MDEEEEKEQQQQLEKKQNSTLKKGFDKGFRAAGRAAGRKIKEFFLKIIKAIAPYLLKIFLVVIAVVIIAEVSSKILKLFESSEAKEIVANTIEYTYVPLEYLENGGNGEDKKPEPGYRINVTMDLENKGYAINCSFYSPSGNPVDEEAVIESTKNGLKKANINPNLFTDSEIKILAVMAKNGLKFKDYTADYLRCLPLFVKAEIASQNFDLRDADHIGEEVDIRDIAQQDFVYGTLRIQRTTIKDNGDADPEYNSQLLQYLDYGTDDKEGTFKYLIKSENIDEAIKYFSINEDGNLVVAHWNTSVTTVSYSDNNSNALTEEQINSIPENYRIEPQNNISLVCSSPVDYKTNIKEYSLSVGFLSDLLIATENASFCTDLCSLAFNGNILIDLREELTHRETNGLTTYVSTKLMQEYVKYNIVGDRVTSSSSWVYVDHGYGSVPWADLRVKYPGVDDSSKYKVSSYYNGSQLEWTLYKNNTSTSSTPVDLSPTSYETEYGDLIKNGTRDGIPFTEENINTYYIAHTTITNNNSYKLEISKIDNWFLKYEKKYDTPKKETSQSNNSSSEEGEYASKILKQTSNQAEMESDERAVEFLKEKIAEKRRTTSYQNIRGSLVQITYRQWSKEDIDSSSVTNTTRYKYGEEIPETTEVQFKNVQYVDDIPKFIATYTDEDGNEQDEIGILYIYDRYAQYKDLFLQEDAEENFFEMLEEPPKNEAESTELYSRIMKFLLYAYDGIYRGESEFDLSVFKPKDFKTAGSSRSRGIVEFLRSYENNWLREYRNGTASPGTVALVLERKYARVNPETGEIEYGLDELNFTDPNGNTDHSLNYSYGLRIYDFETHQMASERFIEYFGDEGINLEEKVAERLNGNDEERGWVNADLADRVQLRLINDDKQKIKNKYLDEGIELTNNELDALLITAYGHGNANPTPTGVSLLKEYKAAENDEQKEAIKNKMISNFTVDATFHPFTFVNWVNSGRAEGIIAIFFEGRYILSTGEEIFESGGDLVNAAYEVADHYLTGGVEVHYAGSSVSECPNNGRVVVSPLQSSWDLPLEQPANYGIVCATFVSLSIWKAGLLEEDFINRYGFHGVVGVDAMLKDAGWQVIGSIDDLECGDVVITTGHTFICLEDGKGIDQAYCVIRSSGEDDRRKPINVEGFRSSFVRGYRPSA